MYSCSNCGGDLKFDIASQKLACVYCDAKYDPYEISKETDGEQDEYDVTVFKCPQCGGEIYSTDNTAAGFCSFCGASTVLTSRLKREHRVNYIIPFRQTKEDCKKAYKKMMHYALFAPKELKNAKNIDGFRGIYMPYWVYHVKQQGAARIHGTKSHTRGDYIITRHYGLHMNMDAQYKGLSYDASSSFADNISEKLGPYDVKNMRAFTPSMLSGFYADISDVDAQTYEKDAREFAKEQTASYIRKSREVRSYTLDDSEGLKNSIPTEIARTDSAMFPVWFLSYQNHDRVAYATVNGQTGKIVADLTVDIKKDVFGSLFLAIPIILVLNMCLTIRPTVLLAMSAVMTAIVAALHSAEMKQIVLKEKYEDDLGAQVALQGYHKRQASTRPERAKLSASRMVSTIFIILTLVCFLVGFNAALEVKSVSIGGTYFYICLAALIVTFIFGRKSITAAKDVDVFKHRKYGGAYAIVAALLAAIISFVNPVSDIYYYIGVMVVLLAMVFTLLDLIQNYNILSTRRLPQFDYKGGDDYA